MTAPRVIETDICLIGAGITAAMMAESLAARTTAHITVIEAGTHTTALRDRYARRQRWKDYGESPWTKDHVDDQNALGTA
ncbi:MAG: hypothetical protein ACKOFO_10790, partial [Gemmatimonadota bacterium]